MSVDLGKHKLGMYWLTGSQKFALTRGITESLAGRVAIMDLLGLSLSEIKGRAKTTGKFFLHQRNFTFFLHKLLLLATLR